MDERPVTKYAQAPDGVSIAYQVTGKGPPDLLFMQGLGYPIELLREDPGFIHFAKRLRGFSRTIWNEVRGFGASGGDYGDAFNEIGHADLTAVLDSLGCEQVALLGSSMAGSSAIRYAATHPERVSALVLASTYAYYVRSDDYPVGVPPDTLEAYLASVKTAWGTGADVKFLAPSKSSDIEFVQRIARCQRHGVSPDQIATSTRLGFLHDVRHLLTTLAVPTLVLHREGDLFIRVEAGRYMAEHIPGAKYTELSGDDHLYFVGDTDGLLDEVEEFLTGTHQAPEGNVVLGTILFTDIVNSTAQQAAMGLRSWTRLMEEHDALVRGALGHHRGRVVKSMGDGVLAIFDVTTGAVRCASEIVKQAAGIGLELRAGLHTGEVEVSPDDVTGLAVTIAKRICDLAGSGQVLVSETVKGQLVGSGITTSERGAHVLKGVPDDWRLFAVEG